MFLMTGMLSRQGRRETPSPFLHGCSLMLSNIVNTKMEFSVHTYRPLHSPAYLSKFQQEANPNIFIN